MYGVYSQQGGASITLNEIIITSNGANIYTSLDGGVSWITNAIGRGTAQDTVIWGNNEFVFIRSGTFFTSSDGITWTNTGVTLTGINKFIYANGYYFVSIGNGLGIGSIVARQSFSTGSWVTAYTTPTTKLINTLTYYNGRVYFISLPTSGPPTFHSISASSFTVANYGVINSGIGEVIITELHRVHNGWVAGWNNIIAYTTTNTGWSISTNVHYGANLILITDADNFSPARDYVAVFSRNSGNTAATGARFDGTGNTGTNSMRSTMTNVYTDGVYFYCWSTTATVGVYRRLITNWSATWTRDANATTAGINGNFTLMATGGTPNNVYIIRSGTLYKTVSGSGTYTSLGTHSGALRFAGRV